MGGNVETRGATGVFTVAAAGQPAAELTRDEVSRYSRHLIIPDLGVVGQKRLKNARVLVIGAGGLGSPTLLYLAAAGVGTIGVVEFDVVDESNLQRQIIHGQSDIGRSKAQSARDSILELNPLVTVHLHEMRLEPDNVRRTVRAVRPDHRRHRQLRDADIWSTTPRVLLGKPYVWGRSTASRARCRCSGGRPRRP